MISIHSDEIQKYLTPYRYPKPVLHGSGQEGAFDRESVDIPFVFRHNGQFYMLYTGFDGIGYQSALAVSDDLVSWKHKGVIFPRRLNSGRWDSVGGAVTWMIKKSDSLWDTPELEKIDGRYWCVYHSYPQNGYEAGPAEIGMAWCDDEELLTWHPLDQPVFSWKGGKEWEAGGLYKACIIKKDDLWYMFYNAKDRQARWVEQTGLAWSKDLQNWERYPDNPILKIDKNSWDERFVSDPYIVQDGDIWLNYYFGLGPGHAQEGLALSKDLLNWEKVDEPVIAHGPEGSYDAVHAHKASIVYWNGCLYHFYCATRPWQEGDPTKIFGMEYRTICVAASKPWSKDEA